MISSKDTCPFCGGNKTKGVTTFTVDLGNSLIVIRKVPATICSLCGNEWFSDDVAARIENIVEDAKKQNRQLEVTQFQEVA